MRIFVTGASGYIGRVVVFPQRFSDLVGQGAISYLTAWRMHVAAGLLLDGTGNIGTVACRVGFRSEAAFSIAFKRWAGISPSGYRLRMLRGERENVRAPRSAVGSASDRVHSF